MGKGKTHRNTSESGRGETRTRNGRCRTSGQATRRNPHRVIPSCSLCLTRTFRICLTTRSSHRCKSPLHPGNISWKKRHRPHLSSTSPISFHPSERTASCSHRHLTTSISSRISSPPKSESCLPLSERELREDRRTTDGQRCLRPSPIQCPSRFPCFPQCRLFPFLPTTPFPPKPNHSRSLPPMSSTRTLLSIPARRGRAEQKSEFQPKWCVFVFVGKNARNEYR